MNLDTARRIKKQLMKAGFIAEIRDGTREQLDLINPDRHRMSGTAVVIRHEPDGTKRMVKVVGRIGFQHRYELEYIDFAPTAPVGAGDVTKHDK